MRFKALHLKKAIDAMRDDMPTDTIIDVSLREENFDNAEMCSSMTLTANWLKEPRQYDDNKSTISITRTVEVFPEEENRPPRVTTQESRNLPG